MRYLPITTEKLETIQDEIYSLFPSNLESQSILHYVSQDAFLEKPNLRTYLIENECINYIESMAFMVLQSFCNHSIHIDAVKSAKYSLNIPVKNCVNTYVNFYENKGSVEEQLTPNNLKFYKYDPDQCVLIDRAEMSVPHIISLTEPHNVSNENNSARITLLIRLNKDFELSSYQKKN